MTIQLGASGGRNTGRQAADAFTDLLFNTLIGFVFLFFIAVIFISPAKDTGKVVLDDTAQALLANEALRSAYLGQ